MGHALISAHLSLGLTLTPTLWLDFFFKGSNFKKKIIIYSKFNKIFFKNFSHNFLSAQCAYYVDNGKSTRKYPK